MGKKTKGWIEGTNLNNSPNSQGTLFQGGNAHIAPEHRYQKGYTPERMAEVKKATRWLGPAVHQGEPDWGRTFGGLHRAQQTVARSTVPVEDMHGASIHVLHPDLFAGRPGIKDGAAGTYFHHRDTRKTPGEILVREGHETTPTVIHEIGHHVSQKSGTDHSSYDTPAKRGAEEGFADRYSDKHFRDADHLSRYEVRGVSNYRPYENQTTDHAGILRPEQFHDAYNVARPLETRRPHPSDDLTERAVAETRHEHQNPTLPGLERNKRFW